MKKTADDVQTKLLHDVRFNDLAVVSVVIDDDMCSAVVGGKGKDISCGTFALIQRLVEQIGETDTIAAIFDGFYKADVSVGNLEIALEALKLWKKAEGVYEQ